MSTNLQEVKDKAKATWATGSYHAVAQHLAPMSAHLVRAVGVREGERVLDVASGTGVTAITAARAGARVTGLDLTPELLSVAKEQADLAGVNVEWKQGDAEDLPYRDGEFDVVLSSFGHVFAPRPEVAGKELARVAKPGGRVAFVTHSPENVVAQFFAATAKHVPPPPNAPPSPMLWGAPAAIRERLGESVKDLVFERGQIHFPMLSPRHFWHLFSTTYGPTMKAIGALGGDRAKIEALERDWVAAVAPFWRDNVVRMDYVLARGVKK